MPFTIRIGYPVHLVFAVAVSVWIVGCDDNQAYHSSDQCLPLQSVSHNRGDGHADINGITLAATLNIDGARLQDLKVQHLKRAKDLEAEKNEFIKTNGILEDPVIREIDAAIEAKQIQITKLPITPSPENRQSLARLTARESEITNLILQPMNELDPRKEGISGRRGSATLSDQERMALQNQLLQTRNEIQKLTVASRGSREALEIFSRIDELEQRRAATLERLIASRNSAGARILNEENLLKLEITSLDTFLNDFPHLRQEILKTSLRLKRLGDAFSALSVEGQKLNILKRTTP